MPKKDEARMIFRKKNGGDKEPTNTRTYKSFSSEKVSKSHFSAQNKAYIFNIQNFTTNETSLKKKGEVSSKYHKLGRSIVSGSAFIPLQSSHLFVPLHHSFKNT